MTWIRTVGKAEAAASVHAYASANGLVVVVKPHSKWSRELGAELLQVAKDATPHNVSMPQALIIIGRVLHNRLVLLANRYDLLEWGDGKWYRDRSTEIAGPNGDRYSARTIHSECGGPAGHCDCAQEIRDAIQAISKC